VRFLSIKAMAAVMKPALLAGLMAVLSGCATPGKPESPRPGPQPYFAAYHGRVVRYNPHERYVILECTRLPKEGENITLFRNNQSVAQVVAYGRPSGSWIAANVMDGTPVIGDWFMKDPTEARTREQTPP
jgi:hypothetical protein